MVDTLHIEDLADVSLATIMARKGVDAARIGAALGIDAPSGPRWASTNGMTLISTGPGTWLGRREEASPLWIEELAKRIAGLASVSDQSSAYSLWRISGRGARTLLQRGAAIDFHPDSFSPGAAATTVIAHIGVIVRQVDDSPTYELACFRSYADSFRYWLGQAAAAL